jgi:Lysyl oxidase
MRWLLLLAATGLGLGLAAVGLALLEESDPAELLPDLDQAAPSEISIVRVGDTYRLTFASAVDNVGRGPLLVEGSRPDRSTPTMTVRQTIRREDGSTRARMTRDRMRYVRSETHAHWHLLGFERYELRRAGGGGLVSPDRKTGFCLGDRYDTRSGVRIEGEPEEPVWTEECGRGEPNLLEVREGISPGYGDDYVPELEGQYVDVTGVPAGRYVLVHRANPERTLEESDYTNNAASVLLELRRPAGEIPTIEVLDRCPRTDRCDAS